MPRYSKRMREIMTRQMRADIHKASLDIINNEGWKAFTTENIAAKLGVSRGLLYNYYKNKNSIVDSILEASASNLQQQLRQVVTETNPPDQKLDAICNVMINDFKINSRLYHQLFNNISLQNATSHHIKNTHIIVGIIAAIINEGCEEQTFRAVDAEAAATLLCGGIQELCLKSIPHEEEVDYSLILEIFLNGLLNNITRLPNMEKHQ